MVKDGIQNACQLEEGGLDIRPQERGLVQNCNQCGRASDRGALLLHNWKPNTTRKGSGVAYDS